MMFSPQTLVSMFTWYQFEVTCVPALKEVVSYYLITENSFVNDLMKETCHCKVIVVL